jgi:hypothetical protein
MDENPPKVMTNGIPRDRYTPGETAIQRLIRLRQMCINGKRVLFQFHQFKFWCVVMDTSFDVENWHDTKFTIKLEVLASNLGLGAADPVQAASLNPPPAESLLHQFTAFTGNITSYLNKASVMISTANAVITLAQKSPQTLVYAGASMVPGSTAVQTLIAAAQQSSVAIDNLNTTLFPQYALDMSNAQPFNSLDNSGYTKYLQPATQQLRKTLITANNFHTNFYPLIKMPTGAAQNSQMLDPSQITITVLNGQRAQNKLGQIYKTMSAIVVPTRSYTITVKDPNLAKIALQVYNDPSLWQVLATASGMTNMINTGVFRVTIPSQDQLTGSTPTLSPSSSSGV